MKKRMIITMIIVIVAALAISSVAMAAPANNDADFSVVNEIRHDQVQAKFANEKNETVIEDDGVEPAIWNPFSLNVPSGCVFSGCVGSGCGFSACGGSYCANSGCAGSVCASSVCVESNCASYCAFGC